MQSSSSFSASTVIAKPAGIADAKTTLIDVLGSRGGGWGRWHVIAGPVDQHTAARDDSHRYSYQDELAVSISSHPLFASQSNKLSRLSISQMTGKLARVPGEERARFALDDAKFGRNRQRTV